VGVVQHSATLIWRQVIEALTQECKVATHRGKRGAQFMRGVCDKAALDQGGAFETSHVTTHADPIYLVDDVVHYAVGNMPGAVPRTSTYALNNATLPFVLAIADKGWKRALADDAHLRAGLNVALGRVTYRAVAEALEMRQRYASPESVIGA